MSGPVAPDGCPVDFYALLPAGEEPDIVHAAIPAGASLLELGCGDRRWAHAFTAHRISPAELDADLAGADLRRDHWLTADGSWVTARPGAG